MTSHEIITQLLYRAIIEIRVRTGGGPDLDRRAINDLANLVHNWPHQMLKAETADDWDRILAEAWQKAGRNQPWMVARLEEMGVDPSELPG